MKAALLLIDIQNDYFPGGRNALVGPEAAAEQAGRALEWFRSRGLPVYHVQHVSLGAGATFFLPGSAGVEIHDRVKPEVGEPVIVKHAPSAFLNTGLADVLRAAGIGELVVAGMMSHMCIDTTVRAAQDHGLAVTVLEDGCATKDLVWGGQTIPAATVHRVFMASLNGTFARVMGTAAFLAEAGSR